MIKPFGYALAAIAAIGALAVAGHLVSTAYTVVSAPGRVLNKTLETDNIIATYEWFHDANAQLRARMAQIKSHRLLLIDTPDQAERARLRIEIAAIQQSCRDLANRYNANATKTNKAIFRGQTAPEVIDLLICE